jgi:hypothetical protein
MNFEKFSAVNSSNERKNPTTTKKQEYKGLKYRKFVPKGKTDPEGKFFVSTEIWGTHDIDNNGFKQFTDKESGETVFAVVIDEHAVILKKSKKGEKTTSFKSTRLENALNRLGVIDSALLDANQFINVEVAATNVTIDSVPVISALILSKGEVKAKNPAPGKKKAAEAVETANATATAAPAVAEAPAGAAVAEAEADWN